MKIIVSALAVLFTVNGFACDVCGGVSAPITNGVLTGNNFHFLGLRTNYANYKSFHRESFSQNIITSREHFLRLSIVGRWQFSKRFNAQLNIPYSIGTQFIKTGDKRQNGLGDIAIQANWMALNQKRKESSHTLTVGLGIKTPTGKYANDAWETSNLSPETGSWDPQVSLNYRFSKNKLSMLMENSFSLKMRNPAGYRFGNALINRATLMYTLETKKSNKLLPGAGISYQFNGIDTIDDYLVAESFNSGHIINAEIGINYLSNNWMLNTKWSYPIVQNIAGGDVTSNGIIELGIHYLIQKQ